jgi:hypothetical protein
MKRSGPETCHVPPKKTKTEMEQTKTTGVKAVKKQLEEKLQSGDYYHAQQLYKTLCARFVQLIKHHRSVQIHCKEKIYSLARVARRGSGFYAQTRTNSVGNRVSFPLCAAFSAT